MDQQGEYEEAQIRMQEAQEWQIEAVREATVAVNRRSGLCCSMLQRVAACYVGCSRGPCCCDLAHRSISQYVAVCCSVLQCVTLAVREATTAVNRHTGVCCSML